MPTYQYRCTNCGHDLDVVQRFTDDPLTTCPECRGELRKVYSPVGIVFKGSGFYSTDSHQSKRRPAAKPEPAPAGPSGADHKALSTPAPGAGESAATVSATAAPAAAETA